VESRAGLLDSDIDRRAVQHQDPTVDVSIPAIDSVPGSTTHGPYGQVEPERRRRKDIERDPAQHPVPVSLAVCTALYTPLWLIAVAAAGASNAATLLELVADEVDRTTRGIL
jgi:hypothetical protein